MCGIVGLFLKDEALQPDLGRLTGLMLRELCDRGPDSAGFAVYGAESRGTLTCPRRMCRRWTRYATPPAGSASQ